MPHIKPQSLVQSLTLCNSVKFKVSLLTFYSFAIFQFQGNVKCFWKVFCFYLCLSLSHPRHHHVLVVTLSSLLHIWTTTNFLFQLRYFSTQNQVSDPFFHAGLILANEMKILFLPISYSIILLSLEIMMDKEDQKGLSSG